MTALLRVGRSGLAVLIAMLLLLMLIFKDGLAYLVQMWGAKEEYSYAYLLPAIALSLIWQQRDVLARMSFSGSWAGTLTVCIGLALFVVGQLSTLFIIVQYGFLVALFGAVLAYTGWQPMTVIWTSLALLLFMIPLPDFLYIQLSQQLQLLSSKLGVAIIRIFGISVFLEGNVIDLGTFKLQVVEACSGLRYLFPLATLGFITALFFNAPLWKRLALIASTVPITVLMNSLRIGIIGVLVDSYGPRQAEGFLHDFEGWAVFMVCFALLFVVMWLLTRAAGDRRPFAQVFRLSLASGSATGASSPLDPAPRQAWVAVALLAAVAILAITLPERAEAIPARADFSGFPMSIGEWRGHREQLERVYVDALKFSDYVLADYVRSGRAPVNLYVAYYDSQRKGESAHSPRVCLPGGGWGIESFEEHVIPRAAAGGADLRVNRAVMSLGNQRVLVYYWFQQRGRVITNEYLVKWYLFWDALTRNRSDGSLVRLMTAIGSSGEIAADATLERFTSEVSPDLPRFLPN